MYREGAVVHVRFLFHFWLQDQLTLETRSGKVVP